MTHAEVIREIRKRVKRAGGQRKLARAWHISQAYLWDVIHGDAPPGPKILAKLKLTKTFERKK